MFAKITKKCLRRFFPNSRQEFLRFLQPLISGCQGSRFITDKVASNPSLENQRHLLDGILLPLFEVRLPGPYLFVAYLKLDPPRVQPWGTAFPTNCRLK